MEQFNIALPKWPQCVINGKKVTLEQADEIIRRTDTFFIGDYGNNRRFNEEAEKICKLPNFRNFKDGENYNWEAYDKARKEFEEKWQVVKTEYIFNSWISCCWVGGYHGWCHPDGTIAFCNNIGKWPSVEDVYNDWVTLAKAFPFLDLTCTLMDDEEDIATKSLVTMHVHDGIVEFVDTIPVEKLEMNGVKLNFTMMNKENYYNLLEIMDWANKVYEN